MISKDAEKYYLQRRGMACMSCFSPDLELKGKYATAEIKANMACLLVPVECHTCGNKWEEIYELIGIQEAEARAYMRGKQEEEGEDGANFRRIEDA